MRELSLPMSRHFLDIEHFSRDTLRELIDSAHAMKKARLRVGRDHAGKVLAMIFDKPSTRTRVSFDVAMRQLGGETIVLNRTDMQLGRGETVADTARVLSRYVDIIMLRTGPHATLLELADNASVPVVNGLTDRSHPCQVMADVMTFEEHRGPIEGRKLAWIGDANNVAASWMQAAARLGFSLRVACPKGLPPSEDILSWVQSRDGDVSVTDDPYVAADGADAVCTDVWVSMGDGDGKGRGELLRPYQVDAKLMARAAKGAVFMHCLPAHRGCEVTAEVIDGPQSVVLDEVENRLHAQKAILAWCLESA